MNSNKSSSSQDGSNFRADASVKRKRPRLESYNPRDNKPLQKIELPKDWSFFENTSESKKIGEAGNTIYTKQIYGRKFHSESLRTIALYFGRQNPKSGFQTVSFTLSKAEEVENFIEDILSQINTHHLDGREKSSLIPFFDDKKPGSAIATMEDLKKFDFWTSPHMTLGEAKLHLIFNPLTTGYELVIQNHITAKAQNENPNWSGPFVIFDEKAMDSLLAFIDYVREESDFFTKHQR